MQRIVDVKKLKELGQVKLGATIGNFDGVHLGHKGLIQKTVEDSQKNSLKSLVITFNPHPTQILRPQDNYLINTYEERRLLLDQCKIDFLLEIPFTRDFSTIRPDEFLDQYIFCSGIIERLYLGHDFSFGANKTGSIDQIVNQANNKNVPVYVHSEFKISNITISSSLIRKCLVEGKIEETNKFLGRNFFITGRVIKGEGRGKKIGFPTANLEFSKARIIPKKGVYATKVIYNGMTYLSVTNIGNNPTFNTSHDIHVETHILDFKNDIYGENIEVHFIDRIRDEMKFQSVNELIHQIESDILKRKKLEK